MWGWEKAPTLAGSALSIPSCPPGRNHSLGFSTLPRLGGALGKNWSLSHSRQPQPVRPLQQAPTWRTTPGWLPGKRYPDPHICTVRGLRTVLAYFRAACLSTQTHVSQHQRGNLDYSKPVGPRWGLLCSP